MLMIISTDTFNLNQITTSEFLGMARRLFQCFPYFNIYYNPSGHLKAASVNATVT